MSLSWNSFQYAKHKLRALKTPIQRRCVSTKSCDPLRILFCGSEEFSIASLQALHEEHVESPEIIKSIDVVCRPGKRSGRGLKIIREVPIKNAAQQLGLRVHEIDTFTGWTPPKVQDEPINLIIAVSFGLLVPPRLLKAVKYGGLNVHPSLLPDFRGAAPLHHALLAGDTKTGITLQTLHAEKFDHGMILAQTPYPGVDIPNAKKCTVPELVKFVAPLGAEMLVQGIRDRVFVSPTKEVGWYKEGRDNERATSLRPAPKITTEDRHVDWSSWTGEEIMRRQRVVGPLWSIAYAKTNGSIQEKRVIFPMLGLKHKGSFNSDAGRCGLPFAEVYSQGSAPERDTYIGDIRVKICNGELVSILALKVEGLGVEKAAVASAKAGLFEGGKEYGKGGEEDRHLREFYRPLG